MMISKDSSTIFLRLTILLIGFGIFVLCVLGIPWVVSSGDTGAYLPILLGLYLPAIPFFYALYQTLKLLSYIDQDKAFSDFSVQALKRIKYCAVLISAVFVVGMPYIYYVAEMDDAPGVILIALVIIFASFVIAVFAAVLQRLLQSAIDIKAENDLTV
jgi:hypothetical protein